MEQSSKSGERKKDDLFTYIQEVTCDYTTKVFCTVTKEGKVVEKWIEGQKNQRVFGLDIEWRPNRVRGQDNKAALLQISSPTECLVIQILHLDYVPDSLKAFLQDPSKTFSGVGITEDSLKLSRDHGLVCKGIVELNSHAKCASAFGSQRMSLKDLARIVLHFDLKKSREITMSDWAQPHLTPEQVRYSCLDAWISCSVYTTLESAPKKRLALDAFQPTFSSGMNRSNARLQSKRSYYGGGRRSSMHM